MLSVTPNIVNLNFCSNRRKNVSSPKLRDDNSFDSFEFTQKRKKPKKLGLINKLMIGTAFIGGLTFASPIKSTIAEKLNDTTEVVDSINASKQDSIKNDTTYVEIPMVGNETMPFEKSSLDLMYKVPHKTKLLNEAQTLLGMQEVTPKEYSKLSKSEKNNTQMRLIKDPKYFNDAWCAHTVSYASEHVGMNIGGHKRSVQEFIDWAKDKNIYKPITTKSMTVDNYSKECENRQEQIENQTKKMKEGDFIIWKSSVMHKTPDGLIGGKASHIGIIEQVDSDGTVTVIEGNANRSKTEEGYDRLVVKTKEQAKIGNQEIGSFQEINKRDGVLRKKYTPEELSKNGYSGYIDTQRIVK